MDWGMRHMDVGMDMWIMPQMVNLDVTDLSLVLLMWTVMMAAMMLPSVLPVIVVLVRIGRLRACRGVHRGISHGVGRIQRRRNSLALGTAQGGSCVADDGKR
jgi:hypothetical protein